MCVFLLQVAVLYLQLYCYYYFSSIHVRQIVCTHLLMFCIVSLVILIARVLYVQHLHTYSDRCISAQQCHP
jgi:hypothetical protein